MWKVEKLITFSLVLLIFVWRCHTLRCRTDDGPTDKEIKKVVRTCMRKLGENSDRNNSENSYEASNSDEEDGDRSNYNRRDKNNRGNRFARRADMMDRQQQGYDYSHRNRNQQRYGNDFNENVGSNGNGFDTGSSNYESNRNYNLSQRNGNNQFEMQEDKSCMVQCFFQEMKMTNSDGFPDKHKVTHIVTKDVRDREMKDFLMDSIQECFHFVEMERRREKCVFSKNVVSCLAERAKANCDDYFNETMIF